MREVPSRHAGQQNSETRHTINSTNDQKTSGEIRSHAVSIVNNSSELQDISCKEMSPLCLKCSLGLMSGEYGGHTNCQKSLEYYTIGNRWHGALFC